MKKSMNIANILTILRIIMVPIFMYMLLDSEFEWALIIFVLASLTDFLDGYLARKLNLVTNLGKFLDPLADKILVLAAFIAFVEMGYIPSWAVLIIVSRELVVSVFRAIAASRDVVIAAGIWGKLKTVSQMIAVVLIIGFLLLKSNGTILDYTLFGEEFSSLYIFGIKLDSLAYAVFWISVILTMISGVEYIIKNIEVLKD